MIPDPNKEAAIILAGPLRILLSTLLAQDLIELQSAAEVRASALVPRPNTSSSRVLQESVSTDAGTHAGMYVQVYALKCAVM